ncbi:MAG: formylglycine-generating enzyme family protein [Deltaproteobacteria bacterium]|nr:MAG: formylglycine-generating enzyme family protein [Deltaproteobacteria bacterium]
MFPWWAGIAWGGTLVAVPGGTYEPLYPPDPDRPVVEVASFRLDDAPVTASEFADFVAAHPKWRRDAVSPLFADAGYLSTPLGGDQPVTRVSWFAARAYCTSQGKRLPTEDEWEFAARASETSIDASHDPERLALLLGWYGQPASAELAPVRAGDPNVYGVHDMHGLVWEWVEDFNNTLFGTDGREGGDDETLRFCGAGTLSATDVSDYARFMRVAFRSSLKGSYTTPSLGFRCAADAEEVR